MTTALALAAALALSLMIGSLIRQVDGATLRRWRLSRRWDVSRLAREFIKAADEPLATVRGLTHMINAWERDARRPSERYWLLYLRVFPERADGQPAKAGLEEALPVTTELDTMDPAPLSSASSVDQGDIRTLAATVKALEQQVAGLSKRVEELSGDEHDEGQPGERSEKRKTRAGLWWWNWMSLLTALVPSLAP